MTQWCTQDFILGDIDLTQLYIYQVGNLSHLLSCPLAIFGGINTFIPLGYAPVSDDLQQVLYAMPERGLSQLLVWLCVPQWRLFAVVWN